jgi:hypothetical protein
MIFMCSPRCLGSMTRSRILSKDGSRGWYLNSERPRSLNDLARLLVAECLWDPKRPLPLLVEWR